MSNKLEGKIAVVTVGTSGIGLATAKRFAAEGATSLILILVFCSPLLAQPKKKLIEFGIDAPDASILPANIRQMEKTPFDGCVFYLTSDTPRGRKRKGDFSWEGWGNRAFTKAEMQPAVDHLKATNFKSFTDLRSREEFVCRERQRPAQTRVRALRTTGAVH